MLLCCPAPEAQHFAVLCAMYVMELGDHVVVCLSGSCKSASDRVVAAGALRVVALGHITTQVWLACCCNACCNVQEPSIAINRALLGKPFYYVAGS
jgi:hypothetical protein